MFPKPLEASLASQEELASSEKDAFLADHEIDENLLHPLVHERLIELFHAIRSGNKGEITSWYITLDNDIRSVYYDKERPLNEKEKEEHTKLHEAIESNFGHYRNVDNTSS